MASSVRRTWGEWNVRGTVLASLILQIILILLSPFRRRSSNKYLILAIWSAYLAADVAATVAIGLISRSTCNKSSSSSSGFYSLWAPFLLVHLSGPDTITAFALEDNQLWLRQLLGFVFQAVYIVVFFAVSFSANQLKVPTFIMFFAGVVKYNERTLSLYYASKDKFRDDMVRDPDPGLDYDKAASDSKYADQTRPSNNNDLWEEALSPEGRKQRSRAELAESAELEVVRDGHKNFSLAKALLADLVLGFRHRHLSRDFFFRLRSAEAAVRVLEVELNFAYDVLYTKAVVVHSTPGRLLRLAAFAAVLSALLVFHFYTRPPGFEATDVTITYLLLGAALGLDAVAFLMSTFSDWFVIETDRSWSRWPHYDLVLFLYAKLLRRSDIMYGKDGGAAGDLARPLLFRRWCRSVSGFNLMEFCLNKERIVYLGLQSHVDEYRFKKTKPLSLELWKFIFQELESKAKASVGNDGEEARKVCYARGEGVLVLEDTLMENAQADLMPYLLGVPYDESLLLWHAATELLYNHHHAAAGKMQEKMELSRTMSDYMLYLLIMQPAMMATVMGNGKIRFQDTCAEARRFFRRRGVGRSERRNACKKIMEVRTEEQPAAVKGLGSTSVLFAASMLAKELQKIEGEEDMWRIVGRVWVELMCYAAISCEKTAHSQMVSKGGELLTYVWLMMAHFGLSTQFEENASSVLRV